MHPSQEKVTWYFNSGTGSDQAMHVCVFCVLTYFNYYCREILIILNLEIGSLIMHISCMVVCIKIHF